MAKTRDVFKVTKSGIDDIPRDFVTYFQKHLALTDSFLELALQLQLTAYVLDRPDHLTKDAQADLNKLFFIAVHNDLLFEMPTVETSIKRTSIFKIPMSASLAHALLTRVADPNIAYNPHLFGRGASVTTWQSLERRCVIIAKANERKSGDT